MVYLVSCSQTLWLHEATQTISVMVKRREREGREEGEARERGGRGEGEGRERGGREEGEGGKQSDCNLVQGESYAGIFIVRSDWMPSFLMQRMKS